MSAAVDTPENSLENLELPKPSGPFSIGSTRRLTVHSEQRMFPTRIWFPAREPVIARLSSFLEPLEVLAVKENILRDVPSERLDQVVTHSHEEAKPYPSRFPVLFFVHGLGGLSSTNQALVEDVVSHGYIVIGLSHPGGSLVTIAPNGSVIHRIKEPAMNLVSQTAWLDRVSQQWAEDILAAIDYFSTLELADTDPVFACFDLEKRGIFGYSLGGAVARIVCSHDPVMRFGVNIDGTYYGTNLQATTSCNFMEVASVLTLNDATIEEVELHCERRRISWNALCGANVRIDVNGSKHTTFSDLTLIAEHFSSRQNKNMSGIGYRRCSALVNSHMVAFVQGSFQRQGQVSLPPAADYPEATRYSDCS